MSNSIFYYSAMYKNKIINLLLMNKNFVKLMNPTEPKHGDLDIIDVLVGGEWVIDGVKYKEQGQVFDYIFVNDTTTEQKTFCLVDTDIDSVKNNIFTDFYLYIYIFTSKELVRLTNNTTPTVKEVKEMGCFGSSSANRIDSLCTVIDETLNGNKKIKGIGTLKPIPRGFGKHYSPNTNYYGRCLIYHITNLNDIEGDTCDN